MGRTNRSAGLEARNMMMKRKGITLRRTVWGKDLNCKVRKRIRNKRRIKQ